ncbi:hypothetical protein [Aeromonas phage 13AhydR10PP]|nr:hypothetical protein [Aeromonas phage 13AhydR10PP]
MSSRPLCPKCDQYVPCACKAPFEIAFGAAVRQSIRNQAPGVVMSTPRHGMSIGADYFGIKGPTCAEVAASIRKAHEEQAPFVGFVHHQLDPNVIAVPTRTIEEWKHRIEELRMEIERHGLRLTSVIALPDGQEAKAWGKPIGHPVFGSPLADDFERFSLMERRQTSYKPEPLITPEMHLKAHLCEQELRTLLEELDEGQAFPPVQHIKWTKPSVDLVMTDLQDPDGILNQGLADALDARELELDACYPYLRQDVNIPSCPVIGKAAPEAIDLSEESI